MMETPVAIFKIYVRKLKLNSSELNLILKNQKKQESGRERLII